jgi:choline dehydrogenase
MHVADQAIHREIGDAFVAAALEMGYRRNDDFNGRDQEGIGYFQWNYRRGRRVNPADVYLRAPALKRYVTIVSGAHARAVTFEGGDAVGVEYRHQGTVRTARARREIVLCAGAFNSPQLLQLSGIGDAATLRRYGISVIRDAPAVGANYKDHFTVQMPFACNRNDTLNDDIGTAYRKVRMGLLYLFGLKGPMAHPGTYSGGFLRTSEEVSRPDIELNCNLWTRKYAKTGGGLLDRFSGFTLLPLYLRPDATGTVTIRSANPEAAPEIRCNMFGSDRDRRTMVRAVRILRTIANAPALKSYIVREVGPGEVAQSDEEIVEYIRENGYTAFHPVGTCRMGKDDDAVVDARLRVRGVNRLRVVDASIMPTITSGNTNAPTMMIGEKGAHMILEDAAADRSRS